MTRVIQKLYQYSTALIAFLILWSGSVRAQYYNFEQFSVAEGLPQSQINKIYQDKRGLLWIATYGGGVCSFDGHEFTVFTENTGLVGDLVTDIAEGRSGEVYLSSEWGGISIYRGGEVFNLEGSPAHVKSMLVDRKSNLWIGSSEGVHIYSNGIVEHVPLGDDVNPNVIAFEQDNDQIYVAANNKLYTVLRGSRTLKNSIVFDHEIKSLMLDDDKNLWVGLKQGGIEIVGNNKTSYSQMINLIKLNYPNLTVNAISQDMKGNIWFGTKQNGVFRFNEQTYNVFNKSNGLKSVNIGDLYCDYQNNIWIGTNGEGVIRYYDNPFISYQNIEGLNQSDNFSVLKDHQGRIWVGNGDDGAFMFDGDKVIHLNENTVLPGNGVRDVIETKDHVIWIGTNKGLVRYNDRSIAVYDTTKGLVDNHVKTLMEDSKGSIWIGTNGGGLSVMSNGKTVNYTSQDSLIHNYIHSLFEDREGNVWIGTGLGIQKYDGEKFTSYRHVPGICNSYIGNIVQDKNGKIWVGTDRCIARLDEKEFVSYNVKDGLTSNLIYLMITDLEGNLWVGTNLGLDKLTLTDNSEIKSIEHFGYEEGFKGIECNAGGVHLDGDGNIYFCTVEGIYQYIPKSDSLFDKIVDVHITDIKVFLEDFNLEANGSGDLNWFGIPKQLELPYDQNHLTFGFIGMDLKHPKQLRYSYKLDGFDKHWSPPQKTMQAVYSNLPPGKYTFRVNACLGDNCTLSDEASCTVIINEPPPAFYQKWWFYLILTFVIGYSLYYLIVLRNLKLQKHKELLEQRVAERTSEIQRQNEEKTVMLQEIHHRVKNNLQIINSLFNLQSRFTSNSEALSLFKESRNRVLSMAKIHEKLYEAKDFSKVNIRSYITDLVNEIRHSYSLDHDVELKLKIEDCSISIDSLIPLALVINEIISNSLKYAFTESGKGIIEVELSQDPDGTTHLLMKDNGVGFDLEKHWNEPTSMGMELIQVLIEQLDGEVELKSSEGVEYKMKFKKVKN